MSSRGLPVLVAPDSFKGTIPASRVAATVVAGLRDGGRDAVGFDAAMRAARLVVTGEGRLDEQTLAGKVVGEVATRCRQAGVACHAIVGEDALDDFSLRVLALDGLAEAGTPAELRRAGRALA